MQQFGSLMQKLVCVCIVKRHSLPSFKEGIIVESVARLCVVHAQAKGCCFPISPANLSVFVLPAMTSFSTQRNNLGDTAHHDLSNKDRNNDSSGEDDSDDDAEDSSTSLQSPTETMTFYEGNKLDQSNGDSEAPATVSGGQGEQQQEPQQPTTTQDLLE